MAQLAPACPACRAPFPTDAGTLAGLTRCPSCQVELRLTVLPGFGRVTPTGSRAERTGGDDEAACFFHPAKRAVVPCDRCGRFLCALCDLPVAGEHLCPACIQTAQQKGGLPALERSRIRWDLIVWLVLLLPILVCWIAVPVTALAGVGLAIWRLKAPPSRVAASRRSLMIAIGFGVLLALGGVALDFLLFQSN
jgi:hypothetical protein